MLKYTQYFLVGWAGGWAGGRAHIQPYIEASAVDIAL